MRATTLFSLSMALFLTGNAQQRFISADYTRFFDWFNEQAQTEKLYTPNSTLYIFEYETPLLEEPCVTAEVIERLSIGQEVKNLPLPLSVEYPIEDQINGYDDLWYYVEVPTTSGKSIQGYVWGGYLAKGWKYYDMAGDPDLEMILLGVSSHLRKIPTDINAEIRILQGTQLIAQTQVPGLCVFEECSSSVLLRIHQAPDSGALSVIEASTLTIGCEVGIEKNYFFWDGIQLSKVMSGEFAFNPQHQKTPFITQSKEIEKNTFQQRVCIFSYEDEDFNPVWDCELRITTSKEAKPRIRVK